MVEHRVVGRQGNVRIIFRFISQNIWFSWKLRTSGWTSTSMSGFYLLRGIVDWKWWHLWILIFPQHNQSTEPASRHQTINVGAGQLEHQLGCSLLSLRLGEIDTDCLVKPGSPARLLGPVRQTFRSNWQNSDLSICVLIHVDVIDVTSDVVMAQAVVHQVQLEPLRHSARGVRHSSSFPGGLLVTGIQANFS